LSKIIVTPAVKKIRIKEGNEIKLSCTVSIPEHYRQFMDRPESSGDTIRIGLFKAGKWQRDVFTGISLKEAIDQKSISLSINPALSPGDYFLRFAINYQSYPPTHNSDKIELVVY
jgi:hypothetical protein